MEYLARATRAAGRYGRWVGRGAALVLAGLLSLSASGRDVHIEPDVRPPLDRRPALLRIERGERLITTLSRELLEQSMLPSPFPTLRGTGGLLNGDFSNGLADWIAAESGGTTSPGSVTPVDGHALFLEGDSFLITLQQSYAVPIDSIELSFDVILDPGFDLASSFIPDAFEATLLDAATLLPVVQPWDIAATSFFNLQEDLSANLGPGTTWDGTTATVDISAVPAGTAVILRFDLIGADFDTAGGLRIDNVGECIDLDGDGDCENDNCPDVANPDQTNSDGDSHGDLCDNCPLTDNEDQSDLDGDGLGDVCDDCAVVPNGDCVADPLNCDVDGDGMVTPQEELLGDQVDSDGDSCGDPCDPLPLQVRFTPRTINNRSQGNFVKCRIDLSPFYRVQDIDPGQPIELSIEGSAPILDVGRQITGSEMVVDFPRQDVHNAAPLGDAVEFVLTGLMNVGCDFSGVDHLRVIGEGKVHSTPESENDPSSILDDAERGRVANLGQGADGDLGETDCLVDYQSNYTFTLNSDLELPLPGEVFFYLFEFCGGTPDCSLGGTSGGGERMPSSGGCP